MIELRAFAIIDQIQKQFAGYIGSTALGYYPVAGQAAFFVEIAPGIEINTITNAVLKRTNVKPGAMVVERTFGMLEVHGDSPAEVHEAADAVLEYLGLKMHDRIKPTILASQTVDRIDAHMTQIVNRFRAASMVLDDDTLYVMEMTPAGYAGYAANEAEKAADVKLIHVTVFGASGKLYLAGERSDVLAARDAAESALASLDGREAV
jgi:ethanolamine utilization microcompartment shell protein EutS